MILFIYLCSHQQNMSKIVLEHVREEPIVQGMQNNGSHQNCVCLFINFAFCIRFTYGVFVENLGGKKKASF